MSEMSHTIMIWLPIFWVAQAVLVLRDYFRKRREERGKPPLTAEEKIAIAKLESEMPGIKTKELRWYLTHPKDGVWLLATYLLITILSVIFLPIAVCIWVLPNPNRS